MCEPVHLGFVLGIEPHDIFNCIPVDTNTRQYKKIEILLLWIRQKGKDATYRSLLESISKLNDRRLVEAIVSMMISENDDDDEVGGCSLDSSSTATTTTEIALLEKRFTELENEVQLLRKALQLREFEAEDNHQ